MAFKNLPPIVSERADAKILLDAIGSGVAGRELVPFVTAMTSADHEQTFAIMRGSGNELNPALQLASILESSGLITLEEVFHASDARRHSLAGAAA